MPHEKSQCPRALAGRVGGLVTSSRYDGRRITSAARAGSWSRYPKQVDPENQLPDPERERRAAAALRAEMLQLSRKSAVKRRRSTDPSQGSGGPGGQ
jgi:hypothetical protein